MDSETESVVKAIADQMRAEIAACGKTITSVARETGIHYQSLYRYMHGTRDIPASIIVKVAGSVGVEPSLIMSRAYERLIS